MGAAMKEARPQHNVVMPTEMGIMSSPTSSISIAICNKKIDTETYRYIFNISCCGTNS